MKYNVTLNGKVYEVVVTEKEAALLSVKECEVATPPQPVAQPVVVEPPKPVIKAPEPQPQPQPKAEQVKQAQPSANANIVKSPLPGIVREIKVKVGETVKEGQIVAIIEAMKMENEIVASHNGIVTQVFVANGSKVNSGSSLIELV